MAAKKIFETVFALEKGNTYEIREVRVLNPISFKRIRANQVEVEGRLLPSWPRSSRANALADIDYLVTANVVVCGKDAPHLAQQFRQALKSLGQGFCYADEGGFRAEIRVPEGGEHPISNSLNLGLMVYDYLLTGGQQGSPSPVRRPLFFRACMRHGVVAVPPRRVVMAAARLNV